MATDVAFVSRYDLRVEMVRDVLKKNTKLSDAECQELAVRLLRTVDTVPERIR
ncbi:DUF6307 family protein [Amycolatopsis sp. NPDC054798]